MADNGTQTRQGLSDQVAEEIRALLARRRISGRELARQMGASHSWVNFRLTGRQPIDLNDLERFAIALRVPISELLPRLRGDRFQPADGEQRVSTGEDQTLVSPRSPERPRPKVARAHPIPVANLRRPALSRPDLGRMLCGPAHGAVGRPGVDAA